MSVQDQTRPMAPGELSAIADLLREFIREEVRTEVKLVLATHVPPKGGQISVAAYAAARSISISTVRNAVRAGRLPAIRIGTAVRVPADAEIGQPIVATPRPVDARDPEARAREILSKRRPTTRTSGTASALRVF